jgi:hypothetical protein
VPVEKLQHQHRPIKEPETGAHPMNNGDEDAAEGVRGVCLTPCHLAYPYFRGSAPIFAASTVERAETSKAKKSQIQPMVSECCPVQRA